MRPVSEAAATGSPSRNLRKRKAPDTGLHVVKRVRGTRRQSRKISQASKKDQEVAKSESEKQKKHIPGDPEEVQSSKMTISKNERFKI